MSPPVNNFLFKKGRISPCVPVKLPLQGLNQNKFAKHLSRAYEVLDRFNFFLLQSSLTEANRLVLQERKSSKRLDLSAIRLVTSKKKISLRLLCEVHALLQKKEKRVPSDVGRFRSRQNWIGPENKGIEEAYFYPPDARSLRRGLKNLQEYLRSDGEDPLVQLAIWFAQLLILHPFMDGNGRVARLMIPLFLYQKKVVVKPLFFMSRYFKKHRLAYFHKLYLISLKGRWEAWIIFFLRGIVEEGKRNTPSR